MQIFAHTKSSNSLVIPFMGGLGNQLFQFAAGLLLETENRYEVLYSKFGLENSKNTSRLFMLDDLVDSNKTSDSTRMFFILNRVISVFYPSWWIQELGPEDNVLTRVDENTRILVGYFQDKSIVESVRDELLSRLSSSNRFKPVFTRNKSHDLVIHVRYGDYLAPSTRNFHGLSHPNYYKSAVKCLMRSNEFERIVLVSDDPELAYSRLHPELTQFNIPIVKNRSQSEIDDLAVLTSARGLVMSNSTFSWWGAWLGSNTAATQVVIPTPWFARESAADLKLCLSSWTSLARELDV